ncbi:TRAP transporter substrate-binding protein [Marinimicrococcus flavescens]|uniref:TRAP transporter substrate-binding protein n=1 Tax=Marinimicrococcus flavescens TaxID=3031815 RepID=A0AAP3XSP7_9PROT|nr:TRAP transporter substrate-binding protein [Marinimicrococcus flavescens]
MRKGLLAAAVAGVALAGPAAAGELWRVQTSMAAGEAYYVNMQKYWVPKLSEMTGGELEIELAPVGSVVPYNETMDAIGMGVLQGDITSTVYFTGRSKAFSLLGDLISGYDTPEQIGMFCYHGGGKELLQELYDKFTDGQVHVVGCGTIAKEAFVSKVPIRGVADLEGKKIRSPEGLAAEVFKRAGASAVALPAAETFTGVDKGVVDAADFSSYTMNDSVGMNKVAKYPIYPGIHSMPVIQFTVNKAAWDALSPAHQTIVEVWYRAMIDDLTMRNEITDRELVARDRAQKEGGIEVIDWPQAERDKLRAIAEGAWKDYAEGDPLAQKAYEANVEFMKRIGLLEK